MVNILHGMFDLVPGDERTIMNSNTRNSLDTVTKYDCYAEGINLHVVDTPGFDENEIRNHGISCLIADQVPRLLKDGTNVLLFLFPAAGKIPSNIATVFNFVSSLITKESFKKRVIVFTKADAVIMTEEEEQSLIEEFKRNFLELVPQADDFLNSAKYMFYRHTIGFGECRPMLYPEIRQVFAAQVYSEFMKL
ncbi:hypothetical protein O9G_006029 [Rozella allomycis CSF55]|uniref:AIG1-type G domain-containing protein n=1 Tax=Rozella allomycis (strain CSF55) TaxID=988480 RepID=A0A075B242_ROZAC|nr:hypothetical protein O9G_006029 [Rozella allomycis CSF55]|eukprot:EPZ36625.1 hypothetical protein O9G_006029 [Rozella allomycis CSF55]